jgi:hypothetical protein
MHVYCLDLLDLRSSVIHLVLVAVHFLLLKLFKSADMAGNALITFLESNVLVGVESLIV